MSGGDAAVRIFEHAYDHWFLTMIFLGLIRSWLAFCIRVAENHKKAAS